MSKEKTDKNLYTISEVAELKGVARESVYYNVKRGHLPAQRVGSVYLVRAEDLDSYQPATDPNERMKRARSGFKSRAALETLQAELMQDGRRFKAALRRLDNRSQKALTARLEGATLKVIGKKLGMSKEGARGIIKRAVEAVRTYLEA